MEQHCRSRLSSAGSAAAAGEFGCCRCGEADRRSRCACEVANDVLTDDGRKLAGILVEAAAREPGVGSAAGAVVGIGINVDHAEESLPAPGATSWRIAHSIVPDRSTLLAELLVALNNRLTTDWSRSLADYRRCCRTLGTGVEIDLPGGNRIEGRALDVDDEGHLIVDDGESARTIVAGDVVHATIRT